MTFTIDQLTNVLGHSLSEEQVAAVTAPLDQPLRIVAGAGSGKTTVMAARVLWAVGTSEVPRDDILGLTFTTKAATQFAQRVRGLLDRLDADLALSDTAGDPGEPTITTYHSFAHRLITEHGLRVGMEPGARLLSAEQTAQLAYRVLRHTRLPLTGMSGGPRQLVPALVALDAELAEQGIEPVDLIACDDVIVERAMDAITNRDIKTSVKDSQVVDVARRRRQLAGVVIELRAAKRAADVIDFSDLLRIGQRLASDEVVRQLLRDRHRLVLLDEYQDTSVVQADLLGRLFGQGHSVTAVGDPRQAIYGWRAASMTAMRDMPELFTRTDGTPAHTQTLSISHRNGPVVLTAANALADTLDLSDVPGCELRPTGNRRVPDGVRTALFETYVEEVEWVADRIAEQVASGTAPEDIAVLCRVARDFVPTQEALTRRGISSQVSTVCGVLSQPEATEILSWLEVLHDGSANAALMRLLMGSRWAIGPRDIALLGAHARRLQRDGEGVGSGEHRVDDPIASAVVGVDATDVTSVLDAVEQAADAGVSSSAQARLRQFVGQLQRIQEHADGSVADLMEAVLRITGLEAEVLLNARRAVGDHQRGLAVIAHLRELARGFIDVDGDSSLGAFLGWVGGIEQFGGEPELDIESDPGAVQLITVHKAKGLEWPVVVIPFLSQQVFPSARGRSRWTTSPAALPHRIRGDRDALPELVGYGAKAHDEFANGLREHALAEETRLAYVAVTRASRLLLASGHWWGPSQKRQRGPSSFLTQIRNATVIDPDQDPWVEETEFDANPGFGTGARRLIDVTDSRREYANRRQAAADLVRSSRGQQIHTPIELTDSERRIVDQWDEDLELFTRERDYRSAQLSGSLTSATGIVEAARDERAAGRRTRRPMPTEPLAARERGTRFHAWVERRYGMTPLTLDVAVELPDEVSNGELMDPFITGEFAGQQPVGVELPFTVAIADRVLIGRIDAVFSDPDRDPGWIVVDWKTGSIAHADPIQLAIYRLAWASIAGVEVDSVRCGFIDATTGHLHEPELPTADELARLIQAGSQWDDPTPYLGNDQPETSDELEGPVGNDCLVIGDGKSQAAGTSPESIQLSFAEFIDE